MGSNQTYIEKADIAVSDLTNSGGLLLPKQSLEFMELLIEESTMLGKVDTIPMVSNTYEVSKAGFTGRVLRPATEGQALGVSDRSKPELGKVQLVSQEYIAEARIPYNVLEDNIAQGTFQEYLMRLLGKAASRDMEEALIQGDTASNDRFLKKQDGLLKQAVSLVVNAGGVRLTKAPLKTMLQTLPTRYLRAQKDQVFFTSKNAVLDYIDSRSNRQTPGGDKAMDDRYNGEAEYLGYPVVQVPMFPENIGTSNNKTNILFCSPKNIAVGIQREVRMETGKDISAREYIVVITVRFTFKFKHEPAVVKATEVLATAG